MAKSAKVEIINYMFTAIISVLACAYAVAKFFDELLSKSAKKQLNDKVLEVYVALGTSDPKAVIQAPIRAIFDGVNSIFGEKLYSFAAFRRYSLATLTLFFCACLVTTLQRGSPFSRLNLPWQNFAFTAGMIDAVHSPFNDPKTLTPELKTLSDKVKTSLDTELAKHTPEERKSALLFIQQVRQALDTIETYNNSIDFIRDRHGQAFLVSWAA